MDASTLSNLLAYSAQVAVIAAVGSLLPRLLRVDAAGVRYAYWRALLLLCLVLPWVQGRRLPSTEGTAEAAASMAPFVTAAGAGGAAAAGPPFNWIALAGGVLVAGAVLRLMWLAAGLMHLRNLRTAGELAPPSEQQDELLRLIASAEIRYVPGLRQPVTFGARRPIVLLPETLRQHPPQIQRAVLCHELFHVQRRDWIWVLVEEGVRAALWFHPGVWWLISRVQLAREEVVDELAVLATGRRRTYIEALMAFSDDTPLAPATAFARQRHLFRRMVLISKEAVMSSRRIVLTCAVMALTILGGSWYAVDAFPMTQDGQATARVAGPLEKQANPITAENPIPARIDAPAALYPAEAAGARGSATLRVTLDAFGRVAEARPIGFEVQSTDSSGFGASYSSPNSWDLEQFFNSGNRGLGDPAGKIALVQAFVRAADSAMRQWRYAPPANAPISFDVKMTFAPDAASISTQSAPFRGVVRGGVPGGVVGGVSGGGRGGVTGGGGFSVVKGAAQGGVAGADAAPVRVGGNIKAPTKIRDVKPVYPVEARDARVQGVVIVEVTIGPDGTVTDARLLRSIPMLDEAALDAVQQWEFTPTLLNGVPVPVIMTATVNFILQ